MAEGGCEQQLRALWGAYAGGSSSLEAAALRELCAALPPARGQQLARRLRPPVPFAAFRAALLALLAEPEPEPHSQPHSLELSDDDEGRELSPKLTLGAKRYGRRSRPPRAADGRLRRCISFPERRRLDADRDVARDDACKSLDPSVNLESASYPDIQYESDNVQYKYVTGDCINVFNKLPIDAKIITERHILTDSDKPLFGDLSKSVKLRSIAEMWESAGISRPYGLLEDLGFKNDDLKYAELLNVLEEETRLATSTSNNLECDFSLTLLRAILCLYRWEISNVKTLLGQSLAERDKLKTDLADANRRAVLLANDVDENHTKLEASTKSQIENLERKHSEAIQRLARQLEEEKEQSGSTISDLEERLSTAKSEETRLKTSLDGLNAERESSDAEKNNLRDRLAEMTESTRRLSKDLKTLNARPLVCRKCEESADAALLEKKISSLQTENTILRDKNDEINAELENSKIELRNCKSIDANCIVSNVQRVKRRSVSPTSSYVELSNNEESPRISKLRKCHDESSESSNDNLPPISASILTTDKNQTNGRLINTSDIFTTESLNKFMLQLKENNCDKLIDVISKSDDPYNYLFLYYVYHTIKRDFLNIFEVSDKCREFLDETIFDELKILLREMNSLRRMSIFDDERCRLDETIKINGESNSLLVTIEKLNAIIEKERKDREEEHSKLGEKCKEYENNIESLKIVYDECEEYWAAKFKEERELYDQEQQINDEKFADLMKKVTEYEEQFGSPDDSTARPLSTIEEKFSLEKQYTDLEDEFQEYKSKMESELEAKDAEIEELKSKTDIRPVNDDAEFAFHKNNFSYVKTIKAEFDNVDGDVKPNTEMNNFDKPLNGNVDDLGPISSPIDYLWSQKTISPPLSNIQTSNDKVRDYHNPVFSKEHKSNTNIFAKSDSSKNNSLSYNNDSVKTSSPLSSPTFMNHDSNVYSKCFDTRIEGKILHCSELEETLQGRKKTSPDAGKCNGEPQSLNDLQENSTIRMAMLEIRYRQIQTAFRQYQMYSEAVMQQTLAAHRDEISIMRQKLAAADLLVRDLYVENCHLTGSMIINPAL